MPEIYTVFKSVAPNVRLVNMSDAVLLGTALTTESVERVLEGKLQELMIRLSFIIDFTHISMFQFHRVFIFFLFKV